MLGRYHRDNYYQNSVGSARNMKAKVKAESYAELNDGATDLKTSSNMAHAGSTSC